MIAFDYECNILCGLMQCNMVSGVDSTLAPIVRCSWLKPSLPELVFFLIFFRASSTEDFVTFFKLNVRFLLDILFLSLAKGCTTRSLSVNASKCPAVLWLSDNDFSLFLVVAYT